MTGEPHFVTLPDGRRLAYAEYGPPDGQPLLYCHGFPSSRREAQLLAPTAASRGVRIISPDRPGYGDSDHQPARDIPDWPADVAALADALGLERFAVIGVSGGAPYALSCAWRIPARLAACTLVCPLGPIYLDEVIGQMSWPARVNLSMARQVPALSELVFGRVTTGLIERWPESVDHLRGITASAADRAELDNPDTRAILNRTVQDAMRAGALGARRDLLLYTDEWGIPIETIGMHVELWHGEADGTVPAAHSRWYEAHLPKTRAHYLPGEGHFSLPLRHAGEILQALLEEAGGTPK